MSFNELRREGIELMGVYVDPKELFSWAFETYPRVKGENSMTINGFSFCVFDSIVRVANEVALERIVAHAATLGIKPWENVVGLKLQAASCLADYLTHKLESSPEVE